MTAPPGPRLALAEGATAIVMDDGLQNPSLAKTLSLLVIDGGYGFGNFLLLPAGPLREPVAAAAARVQAAVLIGEDETGALAHLPAALPVLRARLVPESAAELRGRKIVAFAGIGRPEKFFASVRALGGDLVAAHAFPDHHVYKASDSARLLGRGRGSRSAIGDDGKGLRETARHTAGGKRGGHGAPALGRRSGVGAAAGMSDRRTETRASGA